MKRFAKGLIVLNILALIVTAAAVWLLDRRSAVEMFDVASYVALGMGALGGLMVFGSTRGVSASTVMAASAADQPSWIMDALWGDKISSLSTGALFVMGGISWLGIAWLLSSL
ncbi:hypothetical protein [Microvirga splendida]|uniref:Uncharacterized protein n=1 Tax=Microvirga splendida TaxID=2795727 RepID=A0ABS0Y5W5_9HYPH|nr:hypothetical protein [Microvirga splendida]MBJ6127708.1 hypothetical protein [Microvirga splendida]